MPGLDPKIAVHRLGLPSNQEPYKQPPRKMRQELEDQVCVEVDKWFDVDFFYTGRKISDLDLQYCAGKKEKWSEKSVH